MLGLTEHLLVSRWRGATLYVQNVCDFSQDDTEEGLHCMCKMFVTFHKMTPAFGHIFYHPW